MPGYQPRIKNRTRRTNLSDYENIAMQEAGIPRNKLILLQRQRHAGDTALRDCLLVEILFKAGLR